MLYARGKGDAPPELELAFMCGDNHLPEAGGILDQEYVLFTTMRYLRAVHSTLNNAPKYEGKQIHNMPTSMKRIVKQLNEMHLWNPTMNVKPEKENKEAKGIGE